MAVTEPSENAPAADVAVVDATPAVESAPVAPARRGRKLALVITGAVVAVALVFGGGVAVGFAIPKGGPGFSQQGGPAGLPGAPDGQTGDRNQLPGNGQQGGRNGGPGAGSGSGSNDTGPGAGSGDTSPGDSDSGDSSTDDGA